MGVSPAMFFANDYLLAHEYIFLRDAIQAYTSATSSQQQKAIKTALQTLQFARYADDEVVINRPFSQSPELLFFVDQQHASPLRTQYLQVGGGADSLLQSHQSEADSNIHKRGQGRNGY